MVRQNVPDIPVKLGKLFVISAPSGGGKTTISEKVIAKISQQQQQQYDIQKVITYTSRAPRGNEINGVDYHFVTPEEFLSKKSQDFFLETTHYDTCYYGSPASIIKDLDLGKSFILITDRPGAIVIKNLVPQAVLIWIYVSNIIDIKKRLIERSKLSENPENIKIMHTIERRFALAQQETEQELRENFFKYHVVNDILEKAVQEVCAIIQDELTCDNSSR